MPKYTLEITTWENDADHYSTQVLDDLTAEDAAFYIDIAQQFRSENSRNATGFCLGNDSRSLDTLTSVLEEILARHPNISDKARNGWHRNSVYHNLSERILGWTVDYEDWPNFCRVYERHRLIEIPEGNVPGVTLDWVRKNPLEAYKKIVELHTALNSK